MIKASCPSCSGEITFVSKISLYGVCRFCGNTVVRKDLDVESLGQKAEIHDDGSPIQIGTTGRFKGEIFTVIGRIQLHFPAGYWNEWYLHLGESRDGWLGEAMGFYCVTHLTKTMDQPPGFSKLKAGKPLTLNNESFIVKDIEEATCIGGEGELPFSFEGGYKAPVVDLATPGSRMATIDYSEEPALLFLGHWAEFDELEFGNIKRFEGWQ